MILKNLELLNIRSYEGCHIEFQEGSTLLSGDVGTGKTTILLAIEFALFGLQRRSSGASLLRHGAEEGFVELGFQISKKDYVIRRTLKRKKDAVRQDMGYIIADSKKIDLTAMESKHRILELLGYPPEALHKNNALIYRYTVYTPQEGMQSILTSDDEERVNVIRKIFGIDKYKRMSDNSLNYAKKLRGDIREIRGSIAALGDKKDGLELLKKQLIDSEKDEKQLSLNIAPLRKEKNLLDTKIQEIELSLENYNTVKQTYAALKSKYDEKKTRKESLDSRIRDEEKKLKRKTEELSIIEKTFVPSKMTVEELFRTVSDKEKILKEKELESASMLHDHAALTSILEKGLCETCGQEVVDSKKFQERVDAIKRRVDIVSNNSIQLKEELKQLHELLDEIRKNEQISKELELRRSQVKEISSDKDSIIQEQKRMVVEIKPLVSEINGLIQEIKKNDSAGGFKKQRIILIEKKEGILNQLTELEKKEAATHQRMKDIRSGMAGLNLEIKSMELAKKKVEEISEFESWIGTFFVKLLSTMEKQLMLNIQYEFQTLFRKWFILLVPDDNIDVSISKDFAPIILQNGFETEYAYLSGGERTAIALAYRLSLNKVINEVVSTIRTRDLIILDEPTDGFSSQQMDALRDVLSGLDIKQTIIVSHEPKIESYVDKILRFEKIEHHSRIS